MSHLDDVTYLPANEELKARIQRDWPSNAGDFIRLDEGSFSLIALVSGIPVGLVSAHRRYLDDPLGWIEEAYIDILEVNEAHRRSGIASALVEEVINWARQIGVAQVASWSLKPRIEALHLWHKLGFTFAKVDSPQQMEAPYGFRVARRL